MMLPVPVFLFVGFLGSGKTSLLNALWADGSFARVKTLVLLAEEGEVPLDIPEAVVRMIDDCEELNRETLLQWQSESKARQILIEYNGMWSLEALSKAAPGNWIFYQTMLTADGGTFVMYNANMRALAAEKLRSCTMAMFNRIKSPDATPELRRLVRSLNRKASIYYEYNNGECEQDETGDLLPYDLSADVFRVEHEAFAVWQLDLRSFPKRYEGKLVTICMKVFPGPALGRQVMTCCEADIEQILLPAKDEQHLLPPNGSWVWVTAKIETTGVNRLLVLSAVSAPGPVPEIAVF